MNKNSATIGIIGGSGLYQFPELRDVHRVSLDTPFGKPSDEIILATLDSVPVAFMPRHGDGHVFTPSEVNYCANIYAMKQLGVKQLIAVSAVGSLREEIKPGSLLLVDQFIDRTRGARKDTFFGDGIVAHVNFADPLCGRLSESLAAAAAREHIAIKNGATYVCMEGPAFSTRAESHLYRSWGASLIGMTNLTEAKLAREAQICFSTIAIATDYDCWREGDDVNLSELIRILGEGTTLARRIIASAVPALAQNERSCKCSRALETTVFTRPDKRSAEMMKKLSALFE